ncbi:sporulation and spore germination protein [Salsuginibacillus halophilus]|uniref:Sporulation and spore germination protein n=1 Tax=Salsuginibacillus halophilus TaxID=517424 RepID=A0A2P8H892_9BACI|nr:GerMN domain-containing protein [Salsuginibacillus halophilus]PSL42446.1 sporulation and spore germination protein [Salsuginibacillus halophilus]
MKKFHLSTAVIAASALTLAACGQGGEDAEENGTATNGEVEETTEGADEETDLTDEDEDEDDDDNGEEETSEEGVSENGEADTDEEAAEETESEEAYTETVKLYYSDEELMNYYYEEVEITADHEGEAPVESLSAWLAGPQTDGLVQALPENVEVQSVESDGETAIVSFNEALLETHMGSSSEMALFDQVALIMEQFGYENTQIVIDGEEQEQLFGHMTGTEAVEAPPADEYESAEAIQ